MDRVVVGMSGGIDSFVAAVLLQRQGYEVIGVSLKLWEENDLTAIRKNCEQLNIPLYRRDGKELFRQKVVESFVKGYLSASTPSPCCVCNNEVKWELLRQAAEEMGASYIATGHYVGIVSREGKYYIRKGIDKHKEQSYFLWGVPQDILCRAITPLGEYTKAQVREFAFRQGFQEVVRKRESMGVCFLQGRDYRDFIHLYRANLPVQQSGCILNRTGEVIGMHTGLLNYTIGQKRGLPTVNGEAMYVAEMESGRNIIISDVKAGLWTRELQVKQCRFVSQEDAWASDVTVRIRGIGMNPQGFAQIQKLSENCWRVILSDPAWAVAPGQPVAFYRGDLVIGGGIVKSQQKSW